MTHHQDTKTAIRKRLFLAALARGESGEQFGFKRCPTCQGRGFVCAEYYQMYVMDDCRECQGETVVPDTRL